MHNAGLEARLRMKLKDPVVSELCTERHDAGRKVSQALDVAVDAIQVSGGFLVAVEKRVQVRRGDGTFYRLQSMPVPGAFGPTVHLSPLLVCVSIQIHVSTVEQYLALLWHPFLPAH